MVMVTLSAAEMNGDNVGVVFSDVAGAEWQDQTWNLQTTAQQIDDIPTDADIADAVWDEAMAGHAVAGTFGESVTDGATDTAGAVWDELMAGHVGVGSFGEAIGDISTSFVTLISDIADAV